MNHIAIVCKQTFGTGQSLFVRKRELKNTFFKFPVIYNTYVFDADMVLCEQPGNSSNTAAGNAGGTAAAASGTAKPAGAADNKAAVPAKSGLIPQTSDSFPLLPVAGIALVSLAAVGLLALLKKKKHRQLHLIKF